MSEIERFIKNSALKLYRGFIVEKDLNPDNIKHSEIKTVLLVIRHQMGDMLCSIPMIISVRDSFPSARIILVTKESSRFEEIFKSVPSPVDEVIKYENGFENYISLLKRLQDENVEIAIVPSTVVFSGTNHLIGYHSKAKITAGVRSRDYEKNPAWYLLTVKKDFVWGIRKVHQIERNLDITRQLNIEASSANLKLKLSNESVLRAEMFCKKHFPDDKKKVIGFHPGAGKESNVWPAEKFAELAYRLSRDLDAYIFISEGPADEKYTRQMKAILSEKYPGSDAVIHKGELMTNAAIIDKLSLFVTNDTGIMHIASGLSAPVVALFGETNAYEWGPLGENKISIQSPDGKMGGISVQAAFDSCSSISK